VCVCVCVCVCVSVCVCVCVCAHTVSSMCVYWCMHVCVRVRVRACIVAWCTYNYTMMNLDITTMCSSCLTEFISGLLAMEQTFAKSNKWRLLVETVLSCLVQCMTSDQIYFKFVPLLFRYVCSSVSILVPA